MGSDSTTRRMPIVDLSGVNLNPGTPAWATARAKVLSALESYGCFEAAYHGPVPELQQAAFGAAKELFALPLEAKLRNTSDKVYHAYVGQIPSLPYESLAVDDVLDPAAARGFTDLMWPQGNPPFCETAGRFAEKAAELDRTVRRMVLESLAVDNHYDSHMESTKYVLRFSEYSPTPAGPDDGEDGARLVLPAHVDSNMCTLIYQLDQVDGLEVQPRSGDDWVPFTPSSPDAAVFLVGNAFRAWSNDRLFCPPHRVRMRAGKTRYSIMLFAMPKDGVVIEAPEELVDKGRPRRFRPYRYQDYMEFVAAAGGFGGDDPTSTLTDFCGITGGEGEVQA